MDMKKVVASAAAPETVEMALSATYTVDDGTEYMYTARVGGVDVGGASVIVYDSGDAYIERIDVDDGYRNRGYGTAMLKQLAALYGAVYLAPDNDDARRLYVRLGDDVTSNGSWGYIDQGYGVYAIAA
nr:MAG TPA: acetyltransferase domain containing protein [Caudoviricetes sp.]